MFVQHSWADTGILKAFYGLFILMEILILDSKGGKKATFQRT